jgi:iron complex transport system substrate-binding protein
MQEKKEISTAENGNLKKWNQHTKDLKSKYNGYSVVKITKPWPGAKENFTYVLQEKKRNRSRQQNSFNQIL